MDIRLLHKEGHSVRAIARITGLSRNTVRRALHGSPPQFRVRARRSRLDPFKPYLRGRWERCALSAVRLLPEIQAMGYAGSIITLRRFLHTLRPEMERQSKLTVRFETPPGKQAQADWAYAGRLRDAHGQPVPVYCFVMVLGFSRMLYIEFTRSMRLPELIGCHLRAFAYFGGWPQEILFDNMKQVRLGPGRIHPQFLDFANHYGLSVKTHRVRRPRTKGKVERMVDYLKDNFLNGRTFLDLADLNAQGRHWLDHTANTRLHATTGRAPFELWKQEGLVALGAISPYQVVAFVSRKAGFDGLVRFQRARYSVPPDYAGQRLAIGCCDRRILIRAGDMIVAEHPAADRPGAVVAQPEHVAALWRVSLARTRTPPPHWDLQSDSGVLQRPLAAYQEVCS